MAGTTVCAPRCIAKPLANISCSWSSSYPLPRSAWLNSTCGIRQLSINRSHRRIPSILGSDLSPCIRKAFCLPFLVRWHEEGIAGSRDHPGQGELREAQRQQAVWKPYGNVCQQKLYSMGRMLRLRGRFLASTFGR